MTYRELINQVLIRLREETISSNWSGNINDSSTVSDYQKVVRDFAFVIDGKYSSGEIVNIVKNIDNLKIKRL